MSSSATRFHLRTMLWLVRQFIPIRASVEDHENGSSEVRLQGITRR